MVSSEIKNGVLMKYHGCQTHVVIPDSVLKIEKRLLSAEKSISKALSFRRE